MPELSASNCMLLALGCARKAWGCTNPNPMVGAVIVRGNELLATGYHHRAGEAHAEVDALRNASAKGIDVRGATIYVTLEPCCTCGRTPACTDAIIKAGLSKVVIGCLDPNPRHAGRGVEVLRNAGIEVEYGIEEEKCIELNAPFFTWITTGKPFVMLKMASTLDGKSAAQNGDSFWITGEAARSRVQELRRLADAVMVGAETVRIDHPRLNVREPEDWAKQPKIIVASNTLSAGDLEEYFPGRDTSVVKLSTPGDWDVLLKKLGSEGIMAILIEGGSELAASAISAGAVDYVEFHIAPRILGGRNSRPTLGGENPEKMASALDLKHVEVKMIGSDAAVSGYLKRSW
jgi:diaminohydroxyphosphoribosylaminopyrimidine deaminase/5-amino-6-(5-phosphoribosylamino)uracil reductase